jgi:hypothetical protein
MQPSASFRSAAALFCALASAALPGNLAAQESYESWPVLVNPFESTGGGGILIGEYRPVVAGSKCTTDFTATEPGPGGKVYYNQIEFEAVPAQGGILCTNGKWQSKDGSASGTTPFRVFVKNGVTRRSP